MVTYVVDTADVRYLEGYLSEGGTIGEALEALKAEQHRAFEARKRAVLEAQDCSCGGAGYGQHLSWCSVFDGTILPAEFTPTEG